MTIQEIIKNDYPHLVGKWIDNERGDYVTDECYLQIIHKWDEYLKKYKDIFIRNILQVWDLTQDTGYSVLQRDWERMLWAKKEGRYSKELAEKTLMDKVHAVLGQLWNTKRYGEKGYRTKQFGFAGLLISAYMNLTIDRSEKRDLDHVVLAFGINMTLYGGDHVEFETEES
jgi:hypothetical protein